MSAPRPSAVARPPAGDLLLLGVAVAFISTSGPIIAATVAPALAIAFWRSILGSAATAPWVWWRHRGELGGLTRREWKLAISAGLLLGAHFATWVPSLRFTSVASSTALVATQPVWAALIARARGQEVPRQAWVGIALALVGVVVLTGVDLSLDPRALFGDLLALAGAVLAAAYVTVGGQVRQSVSTASYTFVAYGSAAGGLLVLCVATGQQLTGYDAQTWLLILALTLGAQLLGHTLINRVLSTTSATVTSLAILFEMPGSTLIAAVWLGQVPPVGLIPAVVLLFAGLALVIRSGDRRTPTESPPI
ncbi:MAG: DMT family transporter [Candidatus Nanopelagicales bacterium]